MRYCIGEKLGSGGMAEVFLAVARGPEGFKRNVVVKRIRRDFACSGQFARMFFDEAALSAMLSHPNIVHVYDFGKMDGTYFIAMEYVPGRDLGWLMKHRAQSDLVPIPAVAAEIARQCCLGLDYAHSLRRPDGTPLHVVHRDVTPSNIMIAPDGTVKLLDFGVAHAVAPDRRSHTEAGIIKGKPPYLSPEQAQGKAVYPRSDLFSLGVVLHELLTWQRLFRGDTDVDSVRMVMEKPIPPPSSRNRAVNRDLDRIVLRALERDPDRRYQSAAEMCDDLEEYLGKHHLGSKLRRVLREICPQPESKSLGLPPLPDSGTVPDPVLSLEEAPSSTTLDAVSYLVVEPLAKVPPMPSAPRWTATPLLMASSPGILAILLLGVLGLGTLKSRAPAATAPAAPPEPSVAISIDSIPQGALVYAEPDGEPLGETPLVLERTRDRQVVAYTLRKEGYEPGIVRVIPDQDKPAWVQLTALAPRKRSGLGRTSRPASDGTKPDLLFALPDSL